MTFQLHQINHDRFSNYSVDMSITTFFALLFCSDELIHSAFKKVSSYPNLYAQTKHIMAVSNDLNLGFYLLKVNLNSKLCELNQYAF